MDCVAASIGAVILWLQGKTAWDDQINPDKLKDAAYGENYTGGTSAAAYTAFCASLGFALRSVSASDPVQVINLARQLVSQGTPAIFTEIDPYVDTNLPAYEGWTHVCVFFGEDAAGLTALDPYIAQPVYKSNASWASALRSYQLWIVEEQEVTISLSDPAIGSRFTNAGSEADPQWKSAVTGKVIHGAILNYYQTVGAKPYSGYSLYGLPKSDEIPLDNESATKQFFERGVLAYDPHGKYSPPLGAGSVYALELYTDGPGTDPAIADLESQIAALKAGSDDPSQVAALQAKIAAAIKDLS